VFESGRGNLTLLSLIVRLLELGRWVAGRLKKPSVVEPVDPFERRELNVFDISPRTFSPDHLRFV
jgi:hypothetical protein